jgi:glutamate mutase epsilon subunit
VAVLTEIAVFAAQLTALVAGGGVVAVAQVAAQLVAIVSDSSFVATNIAMQSAIGRECRSYSYSYEQKNPSDCVFHVWLGSFPKL